LANIARRSTFHYLEFLKDWGTALADQPHAGLTARAVVVLDESNLALNNQPVPKIAEEPD
jgi:thiol peroxidase